MKIFGFEITRRKKPQVVEDRVPEVKVSIPDTKPVALMPNVKTPVMNYHSQRGVGRGDFRSPEYNLAEVGRIEDTDSYVRQAFDKKVALMFKEGWDFVGKNPRTIKYIKARLAQIARASQIPTAQLLRSVGSGIVRQSNAFLIKVRKTEASGGKIRREPGRETVLQPVAAYFVAPAETMDFRIRGNRVQRWRQKMPDGSYKEWNPREVIHFYHDRKEGFVYGTPTIVPVVDDIRALRKIEENVELLIYQHLFPLFQYKVGTEDKPAGYDENGEREIDVVRREIQFMPTEGGIVTPERHEIKALGAEGRALRAESYLEHFKKRVFSGMGISAVDMGEGECHDIHTETLTENGWKFHYEIDHKNERIGTLNPNTGEIEFHLANHKYEGYYIGDMIRFTGKHLDAKVTPHHEMYIARRPRDMSNGLEFKKVYAKDLLEEGLSEFYMLETGKFADAPNTEDEITFLANAKKRGRAKDVTCKVDDFASLLGYYLSEGYLDTYNAENGRYRTIISQNSGDSLDRIVSLVDRMGLSYSVIKRNNREKESGVRLYGKALYGFFKNNVPGHAPDKFIPECVWHWGYQARLNLFNALIDGDGAEDNRIGRTSRTYYTSSQSLADDVQILAMSLGFMAKVVLTPQATESYGTYMYKVLISGTGRNGKHFRLVHRDMISKVPYQGEIYCYNVPNHLLVTRRNGKTLISGNTANRACYSEDTQTLTDTGFKYYWEITSDDKIATLNPATGCLEFHKPNKGIYLYDYEGEMLHFKNRNIDTLVTPDHDMFMGRPRNNGNVTWEKIHAENIDIDNFKFYSGGMGWEGINPENFLLPYVPYRCYSEVSNPGPFPRIDIHDWLEFLGYYVSEGTLAKTKGKWAVSISQNPKVNPEKTRKIRECLGRLPFKFNEYTDKNDKTTRFWINCKSLYLYLEENCGDYSYLKHFPDEILDYDTEYLTTVFDAAMLGDGTTDNREGRTSRTYYSKSNKLIDQMQEIALKLGYRAHVLPGSKCKRVCISKNVFSNVNKQQVSSVHYKGKVYCFNVPNHLFFTRRNGRIGVHGNTADNMSRNLIDAVKDLQQVLEIFVNEWIINELLLESTFGDAVLDEDNIVRLKFKEIDVDAQIKKETHSADLFAKDIIEHDEARARMGLEPWIVPTPDEVQSDTDTPENYPQWHKSRWKMYELPKLLIQALDEPWSPAARAAAADSSLPMTEKGNEESEKKEIEHETELEKEKSKAKVAVAKAAPKPPAKKKDFLEETFVEVKKDVVERIAKTNEVDHDWIAALIRSQTSTSVKALIANQLMAFRKGYGNYSDVTTPEFAHSASVARTQLQERAERYVNKLTEDVISALKRNVKVDTQDVVATSRAVFESMQYRARFIEDVEVRKAKNLGVAYGARNSGQFGFRFLSKDGACPTCSAHHDQVADLHYITLDDLPPFHAECGCLFTQQQLTLDEVVQDGTPGSGDDPSNVPGHSHAPCPKCGKTAILVKDTPDIYKCRACSHSFRRVEEDKDVEDAGPGSKRAQYRRCISKFKAELLQTEPTMDPSKAEKIAQVACYYLLDEMEEEDIEDATLEECVKSTKKSLKKQHPDWDSDKIKSSAFAICKSKGKK